MKKRLISLFVALTMLLCLIPAAFAATFNAGTYTASAKGMNGAVTVVLGALVLFNLSYGIWFVGVLAGIDLLFSGITLIARGAEA